MQWVTSITVIVAVAIFGPLGTHARSGGAPTEACVSLTPGHPAASQASDVPGGYFIDTELRDENFMYNTSEQDSYNVTLVSMGSPFRGFLIQMRSPGSLTPIGSFEDLPPTARLLDCGDPSTGSGSAGTITHVNNNDKTSVNVTWRPFPGTSGVVEIRYSVVREFMLDYYANLNAADYPPPLPECPPAPAPDAPESFYPLSFGFPVGCQRTSCNYFVAMGPNPANNSYLDIHLEGDAQGWVAVGFSEDRRMNGTDVLGCRVVDGQVEVIDSWNPAPRPPLQPNMPDASQDGVCPSLTQFNNGRIICRFSRLIEVVDIGLDFNLNSSYFLIFGRRLMAQPSSVPALGTHIPAVPMPSDMMFNPVTDNFTNIQPAQPTVCPPAPDANTNYLFTFGTPGSGYFFGARVNPANSDYLDMRLEGDATGWVAVGFTETSSMDESDVIGCKRDPTTGVVTALDSWNPGPQGTRAPNQLDENQIGLCQFEAQFVNGRISCTFSRLIVPQSNRDFNLRMPLFQIYGTSRTGGSNTTGFPIHEPNTPQLTSAQIIVTDECPPAPDANTNYLFTFGTPGSGYFFGARVNPVNSDYLDMRLEGDATGWVAVGFTETSSMEESDVIGCKRDPTTGVVTVLDSWNPGPQGSRTANQLDENQVGLCQFEAQFMNGRISCTFSRLIVPQSNRDFNLRMPLFQIYGTSRTGGSNTTGFPFHEPNTPQLTSAQIIVTDECPPAPDANTNYLFTFGTPGSGYFFGAQVNPVNSDYLDMRLEGDATGWVAVGFTETSSMEESDVIGCKRDPTTGVVTVLDSWNPGPQGSRTANQLDENQVGLCQFEAQFMNGRISCTFSRLIAPQSNRDFDLSMPLFQIYGMSSNGSSNTTGFPMHTPSTPQLTSARVNVTLFECPPAPDANTNYLFTFGTPGRGYFFGARVNPVNSDYLDMRLEGDAAGWVAIGFTNTSSMEESDVIGCKRDPTTEVVTALDSWNPPNSPQGGRTPNQLDDNQVGLCQFEAQFVNGRISCTFSRLIAPQSSRDLSLSMPLFQIYGTSSTGSSSTTGFPFHRPNTPQLTSAQVNVVEEGSAGVFPRRELLKAHGIFMILSWPLLVVAAIFFAAWMKPALPNGEWFQFHRAFMLAALFLTAVGFILAFVASAQNTTPGLINFCTEGTNTVHFVFGIIVFALQIVNPLIALCRCKPSDSRRWIFNISHATLIGFGAELLALTNVGLGIALFENSCIGGSYTILWVYIGFVIFLLALQGTLFIVFTIIALTNDDPKVRKNLAPSFLKCFLADPIEKQENIEMNDPNSEKDKAKPAQPPKKEPSRDAPLRWVALGVFLFVTLILMLTIVILIIVRG